MEAKPCVQPRGDLELDRKIEAILGSTAAAPHDPRAAFQQGSGQSRGESCKGAPAGSWDSILRPEQALTWGVHGDAAAFSASMTRLPDPAGAPSAWYAPCPSTDVSSVLVAASPAVLLGPERS
eukprot:1925943-Rhodomonas_salina.4